MLLEIPTVNEIIGELSEDETKIYNEIVENFIDNSSKMENLIGSEIIVQIDRKSNRIENLIGSEIIVQIDRKLISSRLHYRLRSDFKKSNWTFTGSYYSDHIKFFISPVYM